MREAGSRIDRGRPQRLKSGRGRRSTKRDKDEEEDSGADLLEPARNPERSGCSRRPQPAAISPPIRAASRNVLGEGAEVHADAEDRERGTGERRPYQETSVRPMPRAGQEGRIPCRAAGAAKIAQPTAEGRPSPRVNHGVVENPRTGRKAVTAGPRRDAEKLYSPRTQSLESQRFATRVRRECGESDTGTDRF